MIDFSWIERAEVLRNGLFYGMIIPSPDLELQQISGACIEMMKSAGKWCPVIILASEFFQGIQGIQGSGLVCCRRQLSGRFVSVLYVRVAAGSDRLVYVVSVVLVPHKYDYDFALTSDFELGNGVGVFFGCGVEQRISCRGKDSMKAGVRMEGII